MKLLRNLLFTLIMSKAVIFSGLFCGEFSGEEIAEEKNAKAPFSCCVSAKGCKFLDYKTDSLLAKTDSLLAVHRQCQELNQCQELSKLIIIVLKHKDGVSHLITSFPGLSLTSGIKEVKATSIAEEKTGLISRKATQNLAQYWDEGVEEKESRAPPLSIAIPSGRERGHSNDWYIGLSPTSPNRGCASPVLVH